VYDGSIEKGEISARSYLIHCWNIRTKKECISKGNEFLKKKQLFKIE
jgi:hypothetical protein